MAIDGLQSFDAVNDDDYDAKVHDVQATVENARQSAATFRDQQVAFALLQYLGSVETERETMRTSGLAQIGSRPRRFEIWALRNSASNG